MGSGSRCSDERFRDGEWNHYRFVANGAVIETWINGAKVTKLGDEEIYRTHPIDLIGLHVRGGGN